MKKSLRAIQKMALLGFYHHSTFYLSCNLRHYLAINNHWFDFVERKIY